MLVYVEYFNAGVSIYISYMFDIEVLKNFRIL